MRTTLLCFITLILFSCKKNKEPQQDPIPNNTALKWIKNYGGSDYDFATSIVQISSGDYIFTGNTRSNDGDIPGTCWGFDAWLTKMDANGNKVWSQTYG